MCHGVGGFRRFQPALGYRSGVLFTNGAHTLCILARARDRSFGRPDAGFGSLDIGLGRTHRLVGGRQVGFGRFHCQAIAFDIDLKERLADLDRLIVADHDIGNGAGHFRGYRYDEGVDPGLRGIGRLPGRRAGTTPATVAHTMSTMKVQRRTGIGRRG